MDNDNISILNALLLNHPEGAVLCSSWLVSKGYSLDLQKRYRRSQWFDSIGTGALIRHGDNVDYLGGIYALQNQLDLYVHPAAKTALSLQNKTHYLAFSKDQVTIFGSRSDSLPSWFKKRDWNVKLDCKFSSFLPPDIGLVDFEHKSFSVKVSHPARAIMECLYLTPRYQSIFEVYEILEGLNTLRPTLVQELLEACMSIKVKRLFLYLAEKTGHQWYQYIDQSKLNLGSGKRSLSNNGVYIPKYQITVPKELV